MDKEALIHFIAGALGGTAGTAFTCPLEVIKTRLQSSSFGKPNPPDSHVRTTAPKTTKPLSTPPPSNKTSQLKFQRCGLASIYQRLIHDAQQSMLRRVASPGLHRLNANPLLEGLLSVRHKSSLAAGKPIPSSTLSLVKYVTQVVRTEGVSALYKGLLPNLVGVAPSKAIYFYTYSTCKRAFNESDIFLPNSAIIHLLSAAFGGFVTATCINPVWLVKTRLQLHEGPLTIRNCIRKVYRNEGIRGFYRGVTASYMGISETIIQFVLYEHLRGIIDDIEFSQENAKFANFMLAGGTAKFIACIITYPHEVVRTRLREENTRAKGFFATLRQLYREGGYRLLYRGVSVQLLRSVPNTAITLGTYEVFVYLLHKYS